MRNTMKHLMIATGAVLLLSTPAMACGGNASCMAGKASCMASKSAAQPADKGYMHKGGHHSWHGKKRHAGYPGRDSHYVKKILSRGDEIGLSEEQRRQIEELYIAAKRETAESRARAETVATEFYGKLKAGKADDAEIDAYAARMGELHAARLKANLAASTKASALLSAEQKKKLYAGRPDGSEKK